MTTDERARLSFAEVKATGDLATSLAYFDSLPAVAVQDMLGAWKGSGFDTGHPLDGMLENFRWHGKRFESPQAGRPLVVDTKRGLGMLHPGRLPMGLIARFPKLVHLKVTGTVFAIVQPLFLTKKSKSKLMMTEYRGVVTATMCYDDLPIHDMFRRVDEQTLLGISHLPGFEPPLLFVLTQES